MNQPANFAFWDTVSDFHPDDIGYLWCGIEPPSKFKWADLPKTGVIALQTLRAAIDSQQLPRMPRYPRDMLRGWVESHHLYRPRFLFPPAPGTSDLNLETALKVIAALAHTVDSRWQPGQRAPHGMVKKVVESAEILGLQLNRNLVGKYLKEIGNKNISA